jgi:glycine betaine/choline ABC-type transport system substrate-binding protein
MKKHLIFMAAAVMLVLTMVGCSGKTETIKIAHKDYTEQRITGQLMSLYLESKGFETEVTELSGTMICYTALQNDNIDLYAEFTGSAYGAIFKQTEILGVDETFEYVKNMSEETDGITWLSPLGWNNTYVLSVRQETADEYNLATISDLVAVSGDMILGSDDEFINRVDGMIGLKELYTGLDFAQEVSMDQGLTYAALKNGEIDVNSSYSTDGRIAKFGLVNLEDDKNFFPPYYVTPILKIEFAEENPEVVEALEELGGHWTEADMQEYNLMVDEGADVEEIARLMLTDAGLLDE